VERIADTGIQERFARRIRIASDQSAKEAATRAEEQARAAWAGFSACVIEPFDRQSKLSYS